MGNGIIDMRETEIDNIQIALKKSISNIDSFTSNFSPSFKDATDGWMVFFRCTKKN